MSTQIISLAKFRARRQRAAPRRKAEAVAEANIDCAGLAAATRALALSIEAVRQQALLLRMARAIYARDTKGAGKSPRSAASIEAVRQQALLLRIARAMYARDTRGAGKSPRSAARGATTAIRTAAKAQRRRARRTTPAGTD